MKFLELKIPPLLVLAVFAFVIYVVEGFPDVMAWPGLWQAVIAFICFSIASFVLLAGVFHFRLAGTTVDPIRPANTRQLVTSGIYKVTRNPMYLAMALLLIAESAYFQSLQGIGLSAGFVAYITFFQIIPEERFLADKFGAAYRDYRKKARRWL